MDLGTLAIEARSARMAGPRRSIDRESSSAELPETGMRWRSRLLLVGDIDRAGMLTAVEHHLQPLRTETDDEVLAVSDHRDSDAAGQLAPLAQLKDVLGDVRFFEFAAVFF